jgi:hypothetical protein
MMRVTGSKHPGMLRYAALGLMILTNDYPTLRKFLSTDSEIMLHLFAYLKT